MNSIGKSLKNAILNGSHPAHLMEVYKINPEFLFRFICAISGVETPDHKPIPGTRKQWIDKFSSLGVTIHF